LFCILLHDQKTRDNVMNELARQQINAVFHYVPLHSSPMGRRMGWSAGDLPVTEAVSQRLLRLPFYYELTPALQTRITDAIARALQKVSQPSPSTLPYPLPRKAA
jgi:dTDP-4-amino-4,6-dideoxygalactose transaminase